MPTPSKLDANQVIPAAFDDTELALRTITNIVSLAPGEQEVEIDSTNDSITIGDVSGNKATVSSGALKVDNSAVTQPISAVSLPLPTGAAKETKQDTGNTSLASIDTKIPSNLTVTSTRLLVDPSGVTSPISGTVTANAGSGTFSTKDLTLSTSSVTSVSSSASNVTLLASNSNRRSATFYNDSTTNCFLKLGATATSSSFTIKIAAGGYYELPTPIYTGIIDGIWDSANGSMRITELT